jgi:hypothetical protein
LSIKIYNIIIIKFLGGNIMDISNLNDIKVDQFEYCTIAEKTYLPAETVKVYIPKLTVKTGKSKTKANNSILVNDPECKPQVSGMINLSDYIIVKTFSGLELSKSAVIKKEECNCRLVGSGGDFCTHQFIRDCKGDNKTFIDGHIVEAYLPKGAQMIVCFMNGNINDAYLTNFI